MTAARADPVLRKCWVRASLVCAIVAGLSAIAVGGDSLLRTATAAFVAFLGAASLRVPNDRIIVGRPGATQYATCF